MFFYAMSERRLYIVAAITYLVVLLAASGANSISKALDAISGGLGSPVEASNSVADRWLFVSAVAVVALAVVTLYSRIIPLFEVSVHKKRWFGRIVAGVSQGSLLVWVIGLLLLRRFHLLGEMMLATPVLAGLILAVIFIRFNGQHMLAEAKEQLKTESADLLWLFTALLITNSCLPHPWIGAAVIVTVVMRHFFDRIILPSPLPLNTT